jgi:HAD superfamily hydrolase (TIGR01509 family)
MIRGVIFDCFGVLYGGSLQTLVSMCPVNNVAELHDLSQSCDRGYITTEEFFEQVSELIGRPVDELRAIASARHTPNQDLIDFADSLHGKVKVGLLSNIGSGAMDAVFPLTDRRRLFDAEVLSFDVHLIKPDPRIFELMADRLGLETSECIMVDDLEENCRGAERARMRSIQHQTNQATTKQLMQILQ